MNIRDSKPELFFRPGNSIWTDPYIQQNLLKAHLDTTSDAASRNPQAIKKTVTFICEQIPENSHILDLGCGPGLYAKQFLERDHQVTGVDFNGAAIQYATQTCPQAKFIQTDYIENFPKGHYDAITLIYCDMGTHSDDNRNKLLNNCYQSLASGGKLIFDVFSHKTIADRKEEKTWDYYEAAGFWSAQPHLLLKQTFHYEENKAFADQYNLITKEGITYFLIWERYFSEEEIISILEHIGFKNIKIVQNLLNSNNFTSNHEMFVIAEK